MLAVALATSFFVLAAGKPVARSLQVHEARASVPQGFVLDGPASPDTLLNLRLGLVSSNIDGLIGALYDVSTPSSTKYGQHLSKAEVETFVAPTTETLDAVHEWLSDNGVTADTTSSAGDWLMVSMPVDKANVMFDANFSVFSHESSGQQSIRTLSYSIPTDLKAHLDFVHPTVTFTPPSAKLPLKVTPRSVAAPTAPKNRSTSGDPAGDCPDTYIDTGCLAALYNIPRTPATEPSNYIVVTGFDDEYANQGDLQTFLYWNRPCMSDTTTFTVEELDGGGNDQDPSDAGYEANLDTQFTVGVATDVPVIFLSVGENSTDGVFGFLDVANDILNNDTLPSVITTSYGSNEEYISFNVANSLCNAYAQLGARGVSVLFSSGDGGVSGTQSESCTDFVPSFPSGCPYVTSVGATQSYEPEVAADFSSGGFSNYWATPSFQASAVSSYLSYLGSTNAGLFNASGRGFPDVSAQGVTFRIAYDGYWVDLDGTSCSSPTFASVIAVLNDQLVANGKPTLGWLNPFLYSTGASAMNDITSGDNPGCNTNGFSATTGWDPVTGLGTPNYDLLLSAAGL
ncbi:family S53 protease-like protein [Wolfiporia cocos MD-104 SS10]|uniref:tripeptidyl-peptidase II n=1 Tax=Wolfiporia cocos (strain MD-104) TaxID=742152 RepID=A0A2H3JBC0_WOLCO|nr:family S53 protease-like protein [Wolfiporia cocos MD-104 SS10]